MYMYIIIWLTGILNHNILTSAKAEIYDLTVRQQLILISVKVIFQLSNFGFEGYLNP